MSARASAPIRIAFHTCDSVGPRDTSFAAPWLAYALPYRRFAIAGARLGADAVRYSFIVADFHHLLLAGFTGAPHARFYDHAGSQEHSRCPRLRVAFHQFNGVGARNERTSAAQWLAYALPYRRFADALADACARLGADAGRYSFIVRDSHPLLLAGLSGRD
jgi:hypothetical protein